jgi:16S rRNA (guanine527-N7)-methyltransferase
MKDIFCEALKKINIELSDREYFLFEEYHKEILFWSKKTSLVSIKSPIDIPIKHFVDSLTVLPLIGDKDSTLIDIGSGAGFPGIPLKIKYESLHVTLVDSSRKKASFLKNVIRKLDLKDITVINNRIDFVARQKDRFDIVISRAAFKLSQLLRVGASILSDNGIIIAMKGKNIDIEIKESANIIQELGLKFMGCHSIKLPIIGDTRKILLFKKP